MKVILPILPDPTEVVLPGAQYIDRAPSWQSWETTFSPIVQNDSSMVNPIGVQVPPVENVGQHNWYGIRPMKVGPKVFSGGAVMMLDIGPALMTSPMVDPIDTWLYSQVPQDATGEFVFMNDCVGGRFDPLAFDSIVAGDHQDGLGVKIPMAEILNSGLLKSYNAPERPSDCRLAPVDFRVGANVRYFFTGTTRDSAGTALASCTVMAIKLQPFMTDWNAAACLMAGPIVSDGSGAFSFQVPMGGPYQLVSYKTGSPDVAGATNYNVGAEPK